MPSLKLSMCKNGFIGLKMKFALADEEVAKMLKLANYIVAFNNFKGFLPNLPGQLLK